MNQHSSYRTTAFICRFLLCLSVFGVITAVKCPQNCKCAWVLDSLEVDCSRSGLIDYPTFGNMPIEFLDLSNNFFTQFPVQLATLDRLMYLDLSNNKIEYIDADALLGFKSLRTLILANNSIQSWMDINPNEVFRNVNNLNRLSLSGNHLGTFSDENSDEALISGSLKHLELERCGITKIGGDILINGLPNVERLSLSGNAITTITQLPSSRLRILELSNCNLQRISLNLIQSLPNLEALNLSWNSGMQFSTKSDNIIVSHSLNELDLSYCNLDNVDLSGLPGLSTVSLRSNMLRDLNAVIFANNTQLEIVDLSKNSLRFIDIEAFSHLKRLSKLDLSYNEIAHLDRSIFQKNEALISLNLSRNIIERFSKLVSNSLREINLSWCEIIAIDSSVLSGLTAIERLDLSNNFIKDFPPGMSSKTLHKLNLSNNRLSAIRNSTFRDYSELNILYLNGNRFTNTFSSDYFRSNKYLDEIWIGDNPWICNCYDAVFLDFYDYLTAKPEKLKDKINVRCASPAHFYGKMWEIACITVWQPKANTSNAEKVWSTIMLIIIVFAVLLLLITCFKKYLKNRKRRNSHREYRSNQEEMINIRRQNQRMLEEDGSPNAPTAYETNLPSYEDAIRMPKLERPTKSMGDLTASTRPRSHRKLLHSPTDPEEDEPDAANDLMLDTRQRFRSEEMLSNRDKERTAQIGPHRRTGYIPYNKSGSRRLSIEDSRFAASFVKSQNLQSAEQIGNFQSYENSPYTKRKAKIADIPPFKRATMHADSVEFLTDPEFDANSKHNSPFARRKPKPNSITIQTSDTNLQQPPSKKAHELAPAVENYFGATPRATTNAASLDGSDFQILVEPEVSSLPDQDASSSSAKSTPEEQGKRRKRKNSANRRASGNFTAAAAAAAAEDSSSSDRDPIVVVHKSMHETLF